MRSIAGWAGALLATMLAWSPAAADDGVLDPSYRFLWTLPALKVKLGAPWWRNLREIVDIRRTQDGGHLILALELPSKLLNIKLDSEGRVEFWTEHEWCPASSFECPPQSERNHQPWRVPDGSIWFQSRNYEELIRIAFDGSSEEGIKIPSKIDPYDIDVLVAPGGSIYLANTWFGEYDDDIAALLRMDQDGNERWVLKVPLRLNDAHVLEGRSELDFLANGDMLWWIAGVSFMSTGPSRDFVMRVAPNGDIRAPGPLERSVPEEGKIWRIMGHHLLPDGRLLRYGEWLEGPRKGFLRLEFWDGTGSSLLAQNLVDLGDDAYPLQRNNGGHVLAARGEYSFYMGGFLVDGGSLIVGFNAAGDAAWRRIVPGDVISRDGTSSIYVITCDLPDPAHYACGASIYVTEIE
jgi:hypothetical protein